MDRKQKRLCFLIMILLIFACCIPLLFWWQPWSKDLESSSSNNLDLTPSERREAEMEVNRMRQENIDTASREKERHLADAEKYQKQADMAYGAAAVMGIAKNATDAFVNATNNRLPRCQKHGTDREACSKDMFCHWKSDQDACFPHSRIEMGMKFDREVCAKLESKEDCQGNNGCTWKEDRDACQITWTMRLAGNPS